MLSKFRSSEDYGSKLLGIVNKVAVHFYNQICITELIFEVITMVCVPCIVIPVLLYIWHRFLQPIFLKFYNPWAKVTDEKKVTTNGGVGDSGGDASEKTELKKEATCPFVSQSKTTAEDLKKSE